MPLGRPHAYIPWATALTVLAAAGCTTAPAHDDTSPSITASAPTPRATPASPSESEHAVHIRLTTETGSFEATLNDSAAARDLATLLPLTLETEDFHQTERIAYPPRKLDTTGAPDASHPRAGDLAYYTPWGNLALFHRDGQHSPSLVILGHLTDRTDAQQLATADRITIENLP
ncbi:cyclophilin-like fold protein [Streptomyces sp. NPDC015184]|uniref:cyclophilin-like fold protein n=1 Tax=Streptomyces sp. NPDC015184 TaxID=3364946 RepID=UPI0036FA7C4C